MSESIQFSLPIPPFVADGANASAQRIIRLEKLVDIPDPCYIVKTLLWAQGPDVFPATAYGDITVAVDPRSGYSQASGFPATQNATPLLSLMKTIGVFEGQPAAKRGQSYPLDTPVAYRKSQGDSIIFAPELKDTSPTPYTATFFLGISWLADADITVPESVYYCGQDTNVPGNNDISIRQMVTGISTSSGWTKLRVRVSSKGSVCKVNHASVGALSGSGPNTVSAPIEITFLGGSAGCVLAPNDCQYSDWIDFPATANLALTFDLFNGAGLNSWAYKATSGDSNYSSSVRSFNLATMGGTPTLQTGRTHILDQIQVR